MEYQEELAVVPLVPVDATPSTDTMLRMVLNHEALLVHHVLNDSLSGRPGQVAQATVRSQKQSVRLLANLIVPFQRKAFTE
ncbi:MAG: hypothetical protein ACLR2M_10090 [Varibaculum sp.]